ncbi:MAG: CHAT domain-containing protein [Anaerolineae bacterium]|nr:CHAT domain-containing protein [Anaerolineae bacterium]
MMETTEDLKHQIRSHWPHAPQQALDLADQLAYHHAETNLDLDTIQPYAEALVAGGDLPYILDDRSLADALIQYLNQQADQYRFSDRDRALNCAQAITRIGEHCDDDHMRALGKMVEGDALIAAGDSAQAAWERLTEAAQLFLNAGDLIGWARTCTGRVGICTRLNRCDEAMNDALLARVVFQHFQQDDRLIRLINSQMAAYNDLGRYPETIMVYQEVAALLPRLQAPHGQRVAILYNNVGVAHLYLGEFHNALDYFQQARDLFESLANRNAIQIVTQNIAYIEQSHGHYQHALHLLHEVLGNLTNEHTIHGLRVKRDLIDCNLKLNQHQEARELAQTVIREFHSLEESYSADLAQVLCQLATAEANLGLFDAAQHNLQLARDLFRTLSAAAWIATITLLQARIALLQTHYDRAYDLAREAGQYFAAQQQRVDHLRALAVQAESLVALGRVDEAAQLGQGLVPAARDLGTPDVRYSAHLLLGRIAEQTGQTLRATRHYRASIATIERLQSGLTINLRPGFLEDKTGATHALIRHALDEAQVDLAFQALERAKAQTLLGYLANTDRMIWRREDTHSAGLLDELNRLRAQHHWLYRLVHEQAFLQDDEPRLATEEAADRLLECERRMRQITDQLYIHSAEHFDYNPARVPDVAQLQEQLRPETLVLAYYDDGRTLSLFTLDRHGISACRSIARSAEVADLLRKLLFNIRCVLNAPGQSGPLNRGFQRLSDQLYGLLLQPVAPLLPQYDRLVIVPYGRLHYLPFHLLRDAHGYLLESHEVVVMPAASLLVQTPPQREPGVRVLAHSREGQLQQTMHEAELVTSRFSGPVYAEQEAVRARLTEPPTQILHIAAHGKYRIDRPELSYIQLADGQLYGDDLLQYDLSYELVTLSACETGQAGVTSSEDLNGLGRSVLLAGAGALLASLWHVADDFAPPLMAAFYDALLKGDSRAQALRAAYLDLLAQQPDSHPALWGAFQLIGHPGPLSSR